MNNNPIHLREQGEIVHPCIFESILPQNPCSFTGFLNHSNSEITSNLKTKFIWIRGLDNFIITLEAHGNALLHSIFPIVNPIKLNKLNEKIIKMCLTETFLICVVKVNNSDYVKFFIVTVETLHIFTPVKSQVLQDLKARSEDFEEIEAENRVVVVRKNGSFQVWSIEENKLLHIVDLTGTLYSKYSRGSVIACFQNNSTLIIQIQNLQSKNKSTIYIPEGTVPYHCELINSSLVLGMSKQELLIIDLLSKKLTTVGTCKRIYEFEDYPDGFILLQDNTGVFISNPEQKINCGPLGRIFVNNGAKLFIHSKAKNSIMIMEANRSIETIRLERNSKVQILGYCKNSSSFYCADQKGLISIFD